MLTIRHQDESSTTVSPAAELIPMRIIEVELGQPLPSISAVDPKTGRYYQRALCVVRLHTEPLGTVELSFDADGLGAEDYVEQIWQTFEQQINEHLERDDLPSVEGLTVAGLPSPEVPRCEQERADFLVEAPFVSIIVPTRDRTDRLDLCLRSLLALDYPHYEVVVVDNAPSSNTTAELVQQICQDDHKVRYLREDHQGPSWARNCGIVAAKGEILAFTDDDVIVDRYWLVELVRGFKVAENVVCVTGLVLPMELETPAQFWFEEYGGFSKGFNQCIFDLKQHRPNVPLYPYVAGRFGAGASMAFKATFLHRIGGFDLALGGTGTVRNCQDADAFFQVIIHGYRLVYRPSSLAHHLHRRDYQKLCKQIYSWSIGFTALLMKNMIMHPYLLFDFVPKLPYALFGFLRTRPTQKSKNTTCYPKELNKLEFKGMFYGPLAYVQTCWALRHVQRDLTANKTSINKS